MKKSRLFVEQALSKFFQEVPMTLLESNIQTVADASEQKAKPAFPPAGPHARPELTNFDACPGAGALPSEMEFGFETDPGAG